MQWHLKVRLAHGLRRCLLYNCTCWAVGLIGVVGVGALGSSTACHDSVGRLQCVSEVLQLNKVSC